MKIRIGDKVKFVNDIGGGIVTAYIDEKTIEVQNEDGFEIPVLASEVLVESGQAFNYDGEKHENTQNINEEETSQIVTVKPEDYKYKAFKGEALLAVVPESDKLLHVSNLNLFLINDSNYSLQYQISQFDKGAYEHIKYGILEPDTKLEVKSYSQSAISKIKSFRLQGCFFKEGLYEPQDLLTLIFTIEGLSFYKASVFSENDYFDTKAYLSKSKAFDLKEAVDKLSNNDLLKVKLDKDSDPKSGIKDGREKKKTEPEEIDLHIEAIVDDFKDLSNGEIVEIQLARFETSLETALRNNTSRIVFIHGVGNGKLKHELRKKLDRKYPDLKYQDASFKEYGYGATLVYLK